MFLPISDENVYTTRPIVNYVLIALNGIGFIIACMVGGTGPFAFLEGLLIVGVTLLFLWITGDNVEAAYGPWGYAAFYLGCGLFALTAGRQVETGWPIPIVGASGAIFGVLGAYVVLYPQNPIRFWYSWYYRFGTFQVQAVYAIAAYIALQLLYWVVVGRWSRVPHGAHLAGFTAGVGLTYVCFRLGMTTRHRPHAWIRPPSSARRTREGSLPSKDAAREHLLIPKVPRRVHLRARGHQARGLRIQDPSAYFLIRADESRINVRLTGEILARELGCPLADATSIVGTTKGFLTREIPEDQAERLVPLLEEAGVRALAVPCKDLEDLPRAILLRGVRIHANGMETRTEWEEFSILWQEIRLVSCGRIRTEKTIRTARAPAPRDAFLPSPGYGGGLYPTGRSVTEKVTHDDIVIDLFHTDPKLRFRFWEGRFALKDIGGPNWTARMRDLAQRIVKNASGPFISPGLTALAQGKDLGPYSFPGRSSYENYIRYLFLLERNAPEILRGGRVRWLEI